MPLSNLPINIRDLLYCRGVESERVEFNASWDALTTGSQVLRTICAFANDYHNLNGGYVVIGVAERDGRGVFPPAGLSAEELDAARKWIRGQCKRLDPPYTPVSRLNSSRIASYWSSGRRQATRARIERPPKRAEENVRRQSHPGTGFASAARPWMQSSAAPCCAA